MKWVMIFDKKGNLSPRYVVPYRILKKVGKVAYELEFPAKLAILLSIFHILYLKKCVNPISGFPLESEALKKCEHVPVEIIDCQVRRLTNK